MIELERIKLQPRVWILKSKGESFSPAKPGAEAHF
jgi:hypothetical protein